MSLSSARDIPPCKVASSWSSGRDVNSDPINSWPLCQCRQSSGTDDAAAPLLWLLLPLLLLLLVQQTSSNLGRHQTDHPSSDSVNLRHVCPWLFYIIYIFCHLRFKGSKLQLWYCFFLYLFFCRFHLTLVSNCMTRPLWFNPALKYFYRNHRGQRVISNFKSSYKWLN